MGSFLVTLLNDSGGFKFYKDNQRGVVNTNNFSPRELSFGNDRPGGGSSNQPYVQNPIQIEIKNPSFYNDFILRGGILAPIEAANDVVRLSKYFADIQNPNGILFTAKQNLLSRIGTKTEASKGIGYAGGALNEGVYLPTSTVAQAGVGFTGTHLNKQGIDPTGLFPGLGIKKYQDVITDNQLTGRIDLNNNRLVRLSTLISSNSGENNFAFVKGYNLNPTLENDVLISYGGGSDSILGIGKTKIKFATGNDGNPIKTLLNSSDYHLGDKVLDPKNEEKFILPIGLSSVYQQSFPNLTTIVKSFNPPSPFDITAKNPPSKIASFNPTFKYSSIPKTQVFNNLSNLGLSSYQYDKPQEINVYKLGSLESSDAIGKGSWTQENFNEQSINTNSETKEDFRKILNPTGEPQNTFLSVSPSYIDKNIETRLNLGNPGQKGNISSYTNGKKSITTSTPTSLGPADKVNASFIYKTNTDDGSNYGKAGFDNLNDIIPFHIAILNNDSQVGGTYKKYMHFRSYIDSFSDSYDAEWNPQEYMGRAEKFYKYGGFSRKITMAFTIVAQSREEITIMYDKLNFLASSLAPEYLDSYTSGYMAGNIAYITLGGYLDDQPGVITSLSYDIPEDSPWEIGIDDFGLPVTGSDVRQMPHMIKANINFTPIHKFRPEKQNFRNDTLGTDSTRLLDTGKQRYLDQLRPESTNYDKEAQDALKSHDVAISKAVAAEIQASKDKMALQNDQMQNILISSPPPTNVNDVTSNPGTLVFGP